jgi:hypothetical protein
MSAPDLHRWQEAGASARRRAQELRDTELPEQHRRARIWALPSLVLAYLGYGIADMVAPTTLAFLAGLWIPLYLMRRIYQPSAEVLRWRRGSQGEQQTARILSALVRHHWVIRHDLQVPGSGANLDHLALVPDGLGAVYIDTTQGGGTVRVKGSVLRIGRHSYKRALGTVKWKAAQAAKALGVPVSPVIAVHGAKVPRNGIETQGLTIVDASRLPQTLRLIRHQHQPDTLAALTARAAANLPRYSS